MSDGYFRHPQAIVETEQVGRDSRVWAFAHILPGARIGAECNICDHVFIENEVVLGDRVTVKNGVQIWDGVTLEDDVFVGHGFMTEAVRTIIPHAFGQLRLHRLEAASMPSNTASIRVLERTGFVKEGLARRYLKISGSWQDHMRFALIADDVDQGTDA